MGVATEQAEPGAHRGIAAYRAVLGLPGVGALTAVGFLARIPSAAAAITLTLHVVLTLDHGYAAAGLVGAAATVGMAIGAPLLGRLVDRRGLRPMLVITMFAETVFWGVAPWLSYPALLAGALFGGLLGLPVYSVIRQSLAAMVPPVRRRAAFALDSMSVETTYIIGPALGALLALQVSTSVAMWAVGAGWFVSGAALMLLNPPTRTPPSPTDAPAPPVREWLDLRLLGALAATTAAVFVVFGTELAMIAGLQTSGQAAGSPSSTPFGAWHRSPAASPTAPRAGPCRSPCWSQGSARPPSPWRSAAPGGPSRCCSCRPGCSAPPPSQPARRP
ncbi:MFS transporter [Pseudonocardia aurantiaca]|uniref:MFS transporter n=1 Tax=Pseudonocardia aurantiaca TaxID=75290 RepID=A0ABW4FK63_9PSEU